MSNIIKKKINIDNQHFYVGITWCQGGLFYCLQTYMFALQFAKQNQLKLVLINSKYLEILLPMLKNDKNIPYLENECNYKSSRMNTTRFYDPFFLPKNFSLLHDYDIMKNTFENINLPLKTQIPEHISQKFIAIQIRAGRDWYYTCDINDSWKRITRKNQELSLTDYMIMMFYTTIDTIINLADGSDFFIAGIEADTFVKFALKSNKLKSLLKGGKLLTKLDFVNPNTLTSDEKACIEFSICKESSIFVGNLFSAFFASVSQYRRILKNNQTFIMCLGENLIPTTPKIESYSSVPLQYSFHNYTLVYVKNTIKDYEKYLF